MTAAAARRGCDGSMRRVTWIRTYLKYRTLLLYHQARLLQKKDVLEESEREWGEGRERERGRERWRHLSTEGVAWGEYSDQRRKVQGRLHRMLPNCAHITVDESDTEGKVSSRAEERTGSLSLRNLPQKQTELPWKLWYELCSESNTQGEIT
jgi:hypothetical protein